MHSFDVDGIPIAIGYYYSTLGTGLIYRHYTKLEKFKEYNIYIYAQPIDKPMMYAYVACALDSDKAMFQSDSLEEIKELINKGVIDAYFPHLNK